MARRSDHTREELKELAIAAGLKIIRKRGFSEFSARAVASEIGYTIGTIYNVFGTYDDFILHLNARTLDKLYAVMEQAAAASKKSDPILALARAYIQFGRDHTNEWLALFEHHMEKTRHIPEWYAPKMTRFFALVEKPLMERLEHNRKKAKRAARVLWAGIHGICILSLSEKLDLVEAESPEILATSFAQNYLAGLMQG